MGCVPWILFNEVRQLEQRVDRGPTRVVRVSVVIPAYNEWADRCHRRPSGEELGPVRPDLEIVVVDDGSSHDRRGRRAHGAHVVVQDRNRGKVRRCGPACSRPTVGSGCSPTPISPTPRRRRRGGGRGRAGLGRRRRFPPAATLVRARRLREIGGRLVNWLTHLVLLGHFRDTQCGVKAFRGRSPSRSSPGPGSTCVRRRGLPHRRAGPALVGRGARAGRESRRLVGAGRRRHDRTRRRSVPHRRWAGEGWYRRTDPASASSLNRGVRPRSGGLAPNPLWPSDFGRSLVS